MPEAVVAACEKVNVAVGDLDMIVPHQANIRIAQTAAKLLNLPMEKFYLNIDKYGNTSSASIPIGLHEFAKSGGLKRGQKICLVGFGAGLTAGAIVFEW
jgi:3-oxoacyl-[acyl-carrier-protein] synthase-3